MQRFTLTNMKTYINNIRACWKMYKDGRWSKMNPNYSFPRYVAWYTWNFVKLELKKLCTK